MATIAQRMLRDALDAFVRRDTELAQHVLNEDDALDALKTQIFRELLTYMLADPATIEPALDLILVSRHLERIGDHATNVAEDVIFMVSASDVRHHAETYQASYVEGFGSGSGFCERAELRTCPDPRTPNPEPPRTPEPSTLNPEPFPVLALWCSIRRESLMHMRSRPATGPHAAGIAVQPWPAAARCRRSTRRRRRGRRRYL